MGYLGDASGFLTGAGSWGFGIRHGLGNCYAIAVLLVITRLYPYAVSHPRSCSCPNSARGHYPLAVPYELCRFSFQQARIFR